MPDDATRDEFLKPLIKRMVGSVSTATVYVKRGYVAADYAVRVITPMWLDLAERHEHAKILRALAPLVDKEASVKAREAIRAIYTYGRWYYAADAAADAAFTLHSQEWYAVYNRVYAELREKFNLPETRRKFWAASVKMVEAMLDVKDEKTKADY